MATALTCSAANDLLARNDSLFGPWIHEAVREMDIWNSDFITKAAFPVGSGYTQRSITIDLITTGSAEDDWTDITASAGGVINPLSAPTIADISFGQTYQNWNPQYKAYKTQCISLDDLRFDYEAERQLTATVSQLARTTAEWNGNRARYEAARLMPQVAARPGFTMSGFAPVTDTTKMVNKAGVPIPTSVTTQSILDRLWEYLLRQGAGDKSSRASVMDGEPVLTWITSRAASDYIVKSNGIRDDFHWGDPGELLKPLGVRRVYKGFAHVCDPEIPRFDLVAGQLVRRLPYTTEAASSGTRAVPNPSYETAQYELQYILPRDAYNVRVINPFDREIAGASFEDRPEYYNAQFFWHNVKDNSSNIFGKLGRWVGLSANASEPVFPKRGVSILALRCPNDQTFAACTCGS